MREADEKEAVVGSVGEQKKGESEIMQEANRSVDSEKSVCWGGKEEGQEGIEDEERPGKTRKDQE